MLYVSQWEQILGCSIHRIQREHTLYIHLCDVNDSDLMLALESVNEAFVDLVDPETENILEHSSLVGKTIIGAIVPYYVDGIGAIAPIILHLDSGEKIALMAEDVGTRIRIT